MYGICVHVHVYVHPRRLECHMQYRLNWFNVEFVTLVGNCVADRTFLINSGINKTLRCFGKYTINEINNKIVVI